MSINRQNLAINQKIFETVAIAGLNGGSRWVRGALGRKVWLFLGFSGHGHFQLFGGVAER